MHDANRVRLGPADLEFLFQEPQGAALQFERAHFLAECQGVAGLTIVIPAFFTVNVTVPVHR